MFRQQLNKYVFPAILITTALVSTVSCVNGSPQTPVNNATENNENIIQTRVAKTVHAQATETSVFIAELTSSAPTITPTDVPTNTPTSVPSETPTEAPSSTPSRTPTKTPTATPVKNHIAAFFDKKTEYSANYSKMDSLAWEEDIKLTITGDIDEFINELKKADTTVAIYGTDIFEDKPPNSKVLLTIDRFIRDGGTALLFYDRNWEKVNDLLQDNFGFSVVAEKLAYGEGSLRINESMLPDWLSDYRIGVESKEIWLYSYIVVKDEGGVQRSVKSNETGANRLVFYERSDGRLILFPRIMVCHAWSYGDCAGFIPQDWFENNNIEFFDNEQATKALLRYLEQ
jgi:hypothetical protein